MTRPTGGETIRHGVGPTPAGFAFIATSEAGICALYLLDHEDSTTGMERLLRDFPGSRLEADARIRRIVGEVVDHLVDGTSTESLGLDMRGTAFQKRVWGALLGIRRGETTTYGELAVSIGMARGGARAVGTACGMNPVSLIVPCHRVLRAGGGLGGYYWGLERKRLLLEIEGAGKFRASA